MEVYNGREKFDKYGCGVLSCPSRYTYRSGDTYRPNCQTSLHHSQDDSIVSYGVYSEIQDNGTCEKCTEREIERNFTSFEREFYKQQYKYNRKLSNFAVSHTWLERWTQSLTKSKMIRTAGKCFIFLLLVSSFGYLLGKSTSQKYMPTDKINLGGPDNLILGGKMHRITMKDFREHAKGAKSFHDIIRVFLKNKEASNKEIEDLLTRKSFYDLEVDTMEKRDYADDDYEPYVEDPTEKAQKAEEHLLEILEHPYAACQRPTPELVHVGQEGHKLYAPEYTVLHRCRNSTGCCWNKSQTCGVKRIQIIERAFFVLDLKKDGTVSLSDEEVVEYKYLINHTECACQDIKPLPGCDQRCPHPFRKERKSEHCTCDCMRDTLPCLEIKYGIEPLGDEEFDCIKSERCMKPVCDEGEFDMRKGYCPGSSRSSQVHFGRKKRGIER